MRNLTEVQTCTLLEALRGVMFFVPIKKPNVTRIRGRLNDYSIFDEAVTAVRLYWSVHHITSPMDYVALCRPSPCYKYQFHFNANAVGDIIFFEGDIMEADFEVFSMGQIHFLGNRLAQDIPKVRDRIRKVWEG